MKRNVHIIALIAAGVGILVTSIYTFIVPEMNGVLPSSSAALGSLLAVEICLPLFFRRKRTVLSGAFWGIYTAILAIFFMMIIWPVAWAGLDPKIYLSELFEPVFDTLFFAIGAFSLAVGLGLPGVLIFMIGGIYLSRHTRHLTDI